MERLAIRKILISAFLFLMINCAWHVVIEFDQPAAESFDDLSDFLTAIMKDSLMENIGDLPYK